MEALMWNMLFRFEPEHAQYQQLTDSLNRFVDMQMQRSVLDLKDDWPDDTWF